LPSFINTDDYYEGHVRCKKCKSLLYLKLEKEKVLKYRLLENCNKLKPHDIKVITGIPRPNYEKIENGK
jgi:hypothetical protein